MSSFYHDNILSNPNMQKLGSHKVYFQSPLHRTSFRVFNLILTLLRVQLLGAQF